MASSFSKEDMAMLSQTIATALQRSGGSRYNPVSDETHKYDQSPSARADAIRTFKNSQDHTKILKELSEAQLASNKSMEALDKAVDYNSKTLTKAINEYEDISVGQKELVDAWKKQAEKTKDDPTAKAVMALIGNMETLEDVLRASDTSKTTADLLKSLQSIQAGNNDIDAYMHQMNHINAQLVKNGKTLNDVDPNLALIHADIKELAIQSGATENKETHEIDMSTLSDDMKKFISDLMKTYHLEKEHGKKAIDAAHTITVQAATMATKAHAAAITKLTGLYHTSGKKLTEWAASVTSATAVITGLQKAVGHLYGSMMRAANTGTQRSFGEVLANEKTAFANGIDPKVLQEIQAKNASVRSTMGRSNFDSTVVDSGEFRTVTGDKGEASKIKAEMLSSMVGVGIEAKDAATATGNLAKSMGKLQYLTGMTGEQLATMTNDLINDKDFRDGMSNLNSEERRKAVENIQLMVEENRVRGLSINQSKELFKAQQDMKHGNKAKSRSKGAMQVRALGNILGIDTRLASEVFKNKGGIDSYVKQHARSPEEEKAMRQQFQEQTIALQGGVHTLQNDDNNRPGQFLAEGLEDTLKEANPMFNSSIDPQTMKANAVIGEAAKEYKEGAEISMGAAKMMVTANRVATAWNNPIVGGIVQGLVGYLITKAPWGKILGAASGALKGPAGKLAAVAEVGKFGTIVQKASGMFSNIFSPTVAAGAAGATGAVGAAGAAGAASAGVVAGGSKIASVLSVGKGVLGSIAKKMPLITAGFLTMEIGSELMDKDKSATDKVKGIGRVVAGNSMGGAAGAGVGVLSGAVTGAAIGSLAGPIGTLVGGAIGGVIGGVGGYYGGDEDQGVIKDPSSKKGESVITGMPSPKQPAFDMPSQVVNEAIHNAQDTTSTTNEMINKTINTANSPDSVTALNKSMKDANQILSNIYTLLKTQADEVSGANEKQLTMQEKLHRAIKNSGSGIYGAPASQANNV